MKQNEISVLLSIIPERDDSYMYHVPNITLTKHSAEAIGIPIVMEKTSGKPPEENLDLKKALEKIKKKYKIDAVVAGAVGSNYQYNIVKKICDKLGLKVITPYWQKSHEELIKEAITAGFEIIIVGVYAHGLDDSWLGRKLDLDALAELKNLNRKFGINIGGEGGEYETLVLDGPIFKKRMEIVESSRRWDGVRGELIIKNIKLINKNKL